MAPRRRSMPAGVDACGPVDRALALAFRLLEAAETTAAAFAQLGDIDLPPATGSDTPPQIQTIAPLYFASELEGACLIPAAEALADAFNNGGVDLDPRTPVTRKLEQFYRSRHERFSAHERRAFFSRLFGEDFGPHLASDGSPNKDFEPRMIDFAEGLYKLYPSVIGGLDLGSVAQLEIAGPSLADNIEQHSGGLALFAGRDVLRTLSDALGILKDPVVQHAVAAHSLWTAVSAIMLQYLGTPIDVDDRVTRGKSGIILLAWLAQSLAGLSQSNGPRPGRGDPVIDAATQWLQASLSLRQGQDPSSGAAQKGA